MNKILFTTIYIFGVLSLVSCGEKATKTGNNVSQDTLKASEIKENIESTISTFPSPVDIITQLSLLETGYRPDLLHTPQSASNLYATSTKQALNLGIYMTDLGYCCSNLKVNEALKYMEACKKLTNELSMLNHYESIVARRFEQNLDNRDSLINIVREVYYSAEDYLHKNKRVDLAALILNGSWVEGVHLAVGFLKDMPNSKNSAKREKAIKSAIAQIGYQKKTLPYLIQTLSQIEGDEEVSFLITKLKELEKTYFQVTITEPTPSDSIPDITQLESLGEVTDQTIHALANQVQMSPETLNKIAAQIEEIRAIMISK